MVNHVEFLVRIAAGAALGGVIGFERDRHGRQVGLRTHLIVAMAAATFMVISAKFVYFQHYTKDDLVAVDSSRIAASVVAGIGFLAGGSILRSGATIQGLTTAAGLWLVTAIGMCAGAGMFVESAVVTGLGIVALTVFRRFEDKNLVRRRVSVALGEAGASLDEVIASVERLGARVWSVEYEHQLGAQDERVEVTFDVQIGEGITVRSLASTIEAVRAVRRVRIQAS